MRQEYTSQDRDELRALCHKVEISVCDEETKQNLCGEILSECGTNIMR